MHDRSAPLCAPRRSSPHACWPAPRAASPRALFGTLALVFALGACDDATSEADPSVGVGADAGVEDAGSADAGGADAGGDADHADTPLPPEPEWCESDTTHLWNPDSDELELFPDGTTLVDDPSSPTGMRVEVTSENSPWIESMPDVLRAAVDGLNAMSGFGTQGGFILRFSAPVAPPPRGANASVEDAGWQLWHVDGDAAQRVPFEIDAFEDNRSFVLYPLQPLPRNADIVLALTRDARDAMNDCIAPSAATRALLVGDDDARSPAHRDRYLDGLDAIGLPIQDVSALTVFRTHDDIGAARAAAEEIATLAPDWDAFGDCEPFDEGWVECTAEITLRDYRNDTGYVAEGVDVRTWSAPLTVWMPAERSGPLPAIIYGHGLNSKRSEGRSVVREIADVPRIVFALEALQHGDHPSVPPDDSLEDAFRFLGIDLANFSLDAFAARGNFEQTALDRLQLLRAILSHPDLDDDGVVDVDTREIAYVGASLGAMMGPQFLALQSEIEAAVLTIGGARVLSVATGSSLLDDYESIITLIVGSRELFDRLVPIAQHVIDPADPGLWSPLVLHQRLDDAVPPSLLAQVGLFDDVVPPVSGRILGRALDLPLVGEERQNVELLARTPALPLAGNFAQGERTLGFFQFDRVTRDGLVREATHTRTALSDEGTLQMRHFLNTWGERTPPEILDPYEVLGTPELE